MNKLNNTDIPTVFLFGKENAYTWNPVRGCANHGCFLHPENKGGCWASVACRLHAKPWAKSEAKWHHIKTNLNDGSPVTKEEIAADISGKLSNFEPTLFQSQLNKVFPKDRSCIFVCSQTDIAFIPPKWLEKILEKIRANNQEREFAGLPLHIWQFLTKDPLVYAGFDFPVNCWLGFTACTDEQAFDRQKQIWKGLQNENLIYAYLEPMIEKIEPFHICRIVDWIIVGGQSGTGAVPLRPDWVRGIRDKCQEKNIPFYFKGWGENIYEDWFQDVLKDNYISRKKLKKINKIRKDSNLFPISDDRIDGQTWHQFPEVK